MNNHRSQLSQRYFTTKSNTPLIYDCNRLQQWLLHNPSGREILRKERFFLSNNVKHIGGKYSLQIGLKQINLLQGNKISHHYIVNFDLKSDLRFLALADNSIDLIVCPHVLEFNNNYHHILHEFYRVLSPKGKLIITCFNRYSWFSLCRKLIPMLKDAQLISLNQLKNQLVTLNFQIEGGKFFSYCPPFTTAKYLRKVRWMNQIGDRWLPTLANSFALIASKEIITPNLIKPLNRVEFNHPYPELNAAPVCHKN
jgi:SAM-dependent methyltransferase